MSVGLVGDSLLSFVREGKAVAEPPVDTAATHRGLAVSVAARSPLLSRKHSADLLAVAAFVLLPSFISASPKLVVLTIDGLSVSDLQRSNCPTVRSLFERGTVGLLSMRVKGELNAMSAHATLDAGVQTDGSPRTPAESVQRILDDRGVAAEWYGFGYLSVCEEFLRHFLPTLDLTKSTVVFVVPCQPHPSALDRRMTPFAIVGPGWPRGVLYSDSTRARGVMSSVDFAPTVLAIGGLKAPQQMSGNVVTSTSSASPLEEIAHLDRWTCRVYQLASPVAFAYAAFTGLVGFVGCGLLWRHLRRPLSRRTGIALKVALLFSLATPTVVLNYSPLLVGDPFLFQLTLGQWLQVLMPCAAVLAFVLWVLARVNGRRLRGSDLAFVFLCAGLIGLCVADVLTGYRLMRHCPIGLFLVTGTRFYGIGNEYMAMVFAAVLLICAWKSGEASSLREAKPLLVAAAAMSLALVALVGLAPFGANFGGAIWYGAGLSYLTVALLVPRAKAGRRAIVTTLGTLGSAAAVTLVDSLLKPSLQSHTTHAVHRVSAEGLRAFGEILRSKVGMNLSILITHSPTWIAFSVWVILIALLWRPPARLRSLFQDHPSLRSICWAGAISSGVGLLTNDSGVVALSCFLSVFVPGMVYVLLSMPVKESLA